eukprot:TRINITY_DN11316_c0_g1_i1.p1 TRINITY_DN11316_c0_g1~~TRINITY_DN11316_c0_g1_i1.p1  ORF type:complete len:429 (+),score=94.47 TRINITY_DN11316_c0_g1_i1:77-1363(+)
MATLAAPPPAAVWRHRRVLSPVRSEESDVDPPPAPGPSPVGSFTLRGYEHPHCPPGTPQQSPVSADPAISEKLWRLHVGEYSHWNVREAPSTASQVIGQRRDGDLDSVTKAHGGWLELECGGWVRGSQGTGGWAPVRVATEAVSAVPAPAAIVLEGFSDATRPTTLRLGVSEQGLQCTVELLPAGADPAATSPHRHQQPPRTLRALGFDGTRSLLLPELDAEVVLRWELLPVALGALRAAGAAAAANVAALPAPGAELSVARWADPAAADAAAEEVAGMLQAATTAAAGTELSFSACDFHWNVSRCQFVTPPRADAVPAGQSPVSAALRRRLRRFFQFYRPEKLPSVVPTLSAHRGAEELIFAQLVDKYGPEPPDSAEGPLRPGWREVETARGDVFYAHAGGAKQWARPSEFLTDGTVWPLLHHGGPS